MFTSNLQFDSNLSAVITRADNSKEDCGILDSGTIDFKTAAKHIRESKTGLERVTAEARRFMPWLIGAGAIGYGLTHGDSMPMMALVTTAGINYLAADFISTSTNHIGAFAYVDAGTGVGAEAIGDTTITPWGGARVLGTQSTPVAGQYRVVATIPFTGAYAITEMGVFSAASAGTVWDRRKFSVINVASGDSIQFTYTVTCTAGGS